MDALNENIKRMLDLINNEKDPQLESLNEGIGSTLRNAYNNVRTATAGVQGATVGIKGAEGKGTGLFQNGINGVKYGAQMGKAISVYKQGQEMFKRIENELKNAEQLLIKLEEYKNQVNSMNIDKDTKINYTNKIDALVKTYHLVGKLASEQVNNTSFSNQQSQDQQPSQPTQQNPETETPTPVRPQVSAPKVTAQPSEPADQTQQPSGKFFNMNTNGPHLNDWLKKNRSMQESLDRMKGLIKEDVLDEANQQEGKFHYLFRALTAHANQIGSVISDQMGGKYSEDSITTIVSLAFETILMKGQKNFINDIKDINNGFNRYRQAFVDLDKPNNTSGGGAEASSHIYTGPSKDYVAEELAEKYIKSHPELYEYNEENLQAVKQAILNSNQI